MPGVVRQWFLTNVVDVLCALGMPMGTIIMDVRVLLPLVAMAVVECGLRDELMRV